MNFSFTRSAYYQLFFLILYRNKVVNYVKFVSSRFPMVLHRQLLHIVCQSMGQVVPISLKQNMFALWKRVLAFTFRLTKLCTNRDKKVT